MRLGKGILAAGALAALLVSAPVRAQLVETSVAPTADMNWSATAGRTVGNDNSVLQVEAGWPGIGFTFLKGLDDLSDVGFHVGFNYGFEGTTNSVVGLNLSVPYRRTIANLSSGSAVALRAEPGAVLYGNNNKGGAMVGIGGPIGIVAGFKLDPRLTLDVGADLPVLITFANPTGLLFGPQFGAGGEYLIDRNLAVTLRARVGPEFALASGGSASQPAFTTLIGLAYNAR
jgi:opacity protein-like surface antigen